MGPAPIDGGRKGPKKKSQKTWLDILELLLSTACGIPKKMIQPVISTLSRITLINELRDREKLNNIEKYILLAEKCASDAANNPEERIRIHKELKLPALRIALKAITFRQYAESLAEESVEQLGINKRICRTLNDAGINRIGRLLECSLTELQNINGIGPASISNIEKAINARGLSLRDEPKGRVKS